MFRTAYSNIATTTLRKLKRNKKVELTPDAYIHSDQGAHYTALLQKLVKLQSMEETVGIKESFLGTLR